TNMALDDIIRYADLRELGDSTLEARQALLVAHAAKLQERLQRDREHLDALQKKIELYRQQTTA
ncbi:MAG TPA: MerR family transcriptional regulator, partial [Pseudomonas sp.]|nr:MerR family transcriptional regulator [Pseudomonas sp.]